MGRRPRPTFLRVVGGNAGKRPLNKAEPKPARAIPSPPEHLSDAAKVAWGRLSVMLDRMGVLTEADSFALERACEVYAEILAYREALADRGDGYTYETETEGGGRMVRAYPEVAMLADADRRLKMWLIEFGVTPAARTKVQAAPPGDKEDPADKYFS